MPTELLTQRRIETAKPEPGKHRVEIRDSKVPGLEIRIGKGTASKYWSLVYTRRSDGRLRRYRLGTFPEVDLAAARRKAVQYRLMVDDGGDPAGELQDYRQSQTFEELSRDWVELHVKPKKSPGSAADDQSMLRRHILPVIGHMKACDVAKRDIIRLIDLVGKASDSRLTKPKTAIHKRKNIDVPVLPKKRSLSHRPNRVFEVVRSIFRWAMSRDLLDRDPIAGLRPPVKKEKPRERNLSAEEVAAFWKKLDQAPMIDTTRLALKLALVTAQRIGEVSCIAKTELSLNGGNPVWHIPAERSKNGESHRVPLSPLAVQLIETAMKASGDSPYLFPSPFPEQSIGSGAATKAMQRARPILGLSDFRVHDLRRTAATGMAELGVNPHTISLVLNHISAQKGTITSAVYVKYSYDKEKREALETWAARLEQLIAGPVSAAAE